MKNPKEVHYFHPQWATSLHLCLQALRRWSLPFYFKNKHCRKILKERNMDQGEQKGKYMLICCQSQTLVSWAKDLPSLLACSRFPGTRQCRETPVVPGFSLRHLQIQTVLQKHSAVTPKAILLTLLYACCCQWFSLSLSWQSWYFSMHRWASSKNAEWMDSSWEDIRKLDPVIPLSQRAESSQWLEDPDVWEWIELQVPELAYHLTFSTPNIWNAQAWSVVHFW